ncbi:hypothetical protein WYO_0870 [Methylobacterium sp. GXF4]|nr:hypothetical protein WYO_0870 [Methylobacterium sp. GXF4]
MCPDLTVAIWSKVGAEISPSASGRGFDFRYVEDETARVGDGTMRGSPSCAAEKIVAAAFSNDIFDGGAGAIQISEKPPVIPPARVKFR